jgi:hypothetical protein
MTAARKRVAEKTAKAIRDARVVAVRAALPPGASRADLEERARSFYPRLSDELIAEVASVVLEQQAGGPGDQSLEALAAAAAANAANEEALRLAAEDAAGDELLGEDDALVVGDDDTLALPAEDPH